MAEERIAFPPAPASTTEQGLVADQQCLAGLTGPWRNRGQLINCWLYMFRMAVSHQ